MKPYKNFLFFLSILCFFAVITLLWGGNTYRLNARLQFKIPNFKTDKNSVQTRPAPPIYRMTEVEKAAFLAIDSSILAYPELQDLPYYPFDYTDSGTHPLAPFFNHLATITDTAELARILHYGDSQIEGDRITAVIRHYLQSSFGGYGMGAVPLFSPVNFSSYVVEKSMHWNKKMITDENPSNALGAWMGYLQGGLQKTLDVTVQIAPYISASIAYPGACYFSNIRILTSTPQNPDYIHVFDHSKNTYRFYEQEIGTNFSMTHIPFDSAQRYCEIHFQNADSSHIYGISLESKYGLTVDNIPVRGSFGNIFSRQKASLLFENFHLLNTKLVLFQFGVNAVPNNPNDTVNAKALENALMREFEFFKALMPDVPLVVIGVSDRAYKNGERYETNPNVRLVRDAQKNAAIRSGCVFWDLFEAMGGENSMVDWVNRTPPLAGKDYTHFSPKGAQRVGEIFYKSLMIAYLNYLKQLKEHVMEQNSPAE